MKLKAKCEIIYAVDGKRLIANPGEEFDVPADVAKLIHPSAYAVVDAPAATEEAVVEKAGKGKGKGKAAKAEDAAPAEEVPAAEAAAPAEDGVI